MTSFKIYEITTNGLEEMIHRQSLKQDGMDMEDMFKTREEYKVENGVAYIDVFGPLARNTSECDRMMGVTDYDQLEDELELAQNDINVFQVVLNFDSPGGESIGSQEIANIVESFPKPVYGVIKGICMSAAYKIASACTYLVSTVSSEVGSIGSIIVITNSKEMMNANGVFKDIFTNNGATFKSIGQDFGNTTDEQKLFLQDKVDKSANKFQDTVINNRPSVNPIVFNAAYYSADEALALGLIDEII